MADTCSGAKDPVVTAPTCYQGDKKIPIVGQENIMVKLESFASGKGVMDLTGSGLLGINCQKKTFSKSGQDITVDLSDCIEKEVTIGEIQYCSDQDSIAVSVKDGITVHATLAKVACPADVVLV